MRHVSRKSRRYDGRSMQGLKEYEELPSVERESQNAMSRGPHPEVRAPAT